MHRAGLPTPAANTRIAGYEVDFVWHAQRLVVEIDGYAYRVLRVTWRRLVEEPEAVAVAIATALAMAA